MTIRDLEILIHSLGLDRGNVLYRNYYAGTRNDVECEPLVEQGFMKRGRTYNDGAGQYYHVTEKGIAFAIKFAERHGDQVRRSSNISLDESSDRGEPE